MPREELTDIVAGQEAWDADINGNTAKLRDGPLPSFVFTGTAAALETAYPAADWPGCYATLLDAGTRLPVYSNGVAWFELDTTAL